MTQYLETLWIAAYAVIIGLCIPIIRTVSKEIKALIRKMSAANVGWVSPRIVGELSKLDIDVAKSTVEKYRVRSGNPPSST